MNLFRWINVTGITAAVFFASAALTGLLEADFRLHKYSALCGILFGAAHASLVLYKNYKFVWSGKGERKP